MDRPCNEFVLGKPCQRASVLRALRLPAGDVVTVDRCELCWQRMLAQPGIRPVECAPMLAPQVSP